MALEQLQEQATGAIESIKDAADAVRDEVQEVSETIAGVQSSANQLDDTPAENGWFFRRWNTFASKALAFILLSAIVIFMGINNQPLMWVALGLIFYAMFLDGLYMGGASILDYAKLAASIPSKSLSLFGGKKEDKETPSE